MAKTQGYRFRQISHLTTTKATEISPGGLPYQQSLAIDALVLYHQWYAAWATIYQHNVHALLRSRRHLSSHRLHPGRCSNQGSIPSAVRNRKEKLGNF